MLSLNNNRRNTSCTILCLLVTLLCLLLLRTLHRLQLRTLLPLLLLLLPRFLAFSCNDRQSSRRSTTISLFMSSMGTCRLRQ